MKLRSLFTKKPFHTIKKSVEKGDFIKFTPVVVTSAIFYGIERTFSTKDNYCEQTKMTGETDKANTFLNDFNDV